MKYQIRKCELNDLDNIYSLVKSVIEVVYPKYYPTGAVDLYLNYHSREKIKKDIINNKVYYLSVKELIKGTVTVFENDISRLYVLPEEQGKGYGTQLLDFAENMIAEKYKTAVLDSSLPSKQMYLKRDYKESSYNYLKADNGDFVCYDSMEKIL